MKIHKLKIENIASLKGPHEVDFDQFQMDHGSFAITGDTGAGKSTILNCISLALYGQNYKKALNQADFVTLGESVGKVELFFSSLNKTYLSLWECRVRKKNGEFLKQPKISKEFYLVEKEARSILEISPEEVIHLSFDQFCKTIILNQGQFSKFLTSGFTERKDILEKLYHGEKLNGFNPLLREKINALISGMEQIEAEISGLNQGFQPDISFEGLKIIEEQFKKAQEQNDFLQELRSHLKDTLGLSGQIEESSLKLLELDAKARDQIQKLNSMAQTRQDFLKTLQEFKERQRIAAPALHQALQSKKTLLKLEERTKELDRASQELEKKITEAQKASFANLEARKKLEARQTALKADPLYRKLDEKEFEAFKTGHQAWTAAASQVGALAAVEEHEAKTLRQLTSEIQNLEASLAQAKKDERALEERNRSASLEELERELFKTQDFKARLCSFQGDARNLREEMEAWESQLQERQKTIKALEERNQDLLKKIELQKDAIKSVQLEGALTLCLQKSIEQKACVVCDSQEISHLDLEAVNKSQEKIKVYEEDMEALEQERIELFQELERARTSQKSLQASLARNRERLVFLKGEFVSGFFERIGRLHLDESDLESEEAAKKLEAAMIRLKKEIQNVQKTRMRRNTLLEQCRALEEQKEKALQKRGRLEEDALHRKKKLDEASSKLRSIEEALQKTARLSELKKNIGSFLQLQEDFFKARQKSHIAQTEASHLREKLEELERLEKERSEQKAKIQAEIAQAKREIHEACPDADPQEALKALEKEGDLFEFKNRKQEEELKNLEIEKSALFSRKQAFAEQLREQRELLLIHWRQLKEALAADKALLKNLELSKFLKEIGKLETPCDKKALELGMELGLKEKESSSLALKESQERLTEYKTLLARQESAQEKIKKLRQELERAKVLKEEWEELYQLIGKDEFRNYILSMVEKLLIQQTNVELAKLCDGRYLIQHKKTSSRLAPDFYIIDKFRGEEIRKVSTLSGGETFMVSLAMALALAELTRGNADLDSFFIDEGFGSLDHDSLEEALTMLQDIETRGKQIGLISHVKELTQRIPVNIHLQKDRLGDSKIEIVYN